MGELANGSDAQTPPVLGAYWRRAWHEILRSYPERSLGLQGATALYTILLAPVLWSGLLYSILGLFNPVLQSHIDWFWFIASQIAFGIVAGMVVVCHHRVETCQLEPFLVRVGIKAPGLRPKKPTRSGSR